MSPDLTQLQLAHRLRGTVIWDWKIPEDEHWWSDECYELLGVDSKTPASAELWERFVHPQDLERARRSFTEAVSGDASKCVQELRVRRRSGDYAHILSKTVIVRDEEGEPTRALAVLEDVTQQRALESRLLDAARSESLGRMAGRVAHDFNNLLTVILGHLELIKFEASEESNAGARVDIALEAARRGGELTSQLLAFARQRIVHPEIVEVAQVLERLRPVLTQAVGPSIRLEQEADPSLWLIKIDPGQFEQVVMNLTANARDAMPKGGSLRFALENSTLAPDAERDWAPGGGEFVCLKVSDTGRGIPSEAVPRVFEPFFTTKEIGAGAGLGLATTLGIVAQSGGHVSVHSEVGQGATFEICLPRCPEADGRAHLHTTGAAHNREAQQAISILLVEDDSSIRDLAHAVLKREDYRVLDAEDGLAALEIARREAEPVDLVLTDLLMPRMGGIELVAELRTLWGGVPVLYTSGYPGDVTALDAPFLPKPYRPQDLRLAVVGALSHMENRPRTG
jgi:two-component system cell cycle sensor histidine kinase/response regulator CckA